MYKDLNYTIIEFMKEWQDYSNKENDELILKAYKFSKIKHTGQIRDEGTPYFYHPYRVALVLIQELGLTDTNIICSALLHDVIEDSDCTDEDIRIMFNEEIAIMVNYLTKPPKKQFNSSKKRHDYYFDRLLKAPDNVLLIKLADRLDNIFSIHLSPRKEKQKKYYDETCQYYLPLAKRINDKLYQKFISWKNYFEKNYAHILEVD